MFHLKIKKIMANAKFKKVLQLIKAVLDLLSELIPIADDALDIVGRVSSIVASYKAEKEELKDADVPATK